MPKPLPTLLDASPICCEPLGSHASLNPGDAVALAVRLKALADPVRLRLLAYLLDKPEQEDCTCNLAPLVDLSEPTVSHHLKKLEASGMLTKERRGMSVYYRVVPEAIRAIASVLHVDRC
ncbi:MAG: metalloregulator ArsR/SmtB family transcription factor [Lacisediminihabitans sp.]